MRLANKVTLITGSASGMGAATARTFGAEGATVIVTDVNDADGERVADDIRAKGGVAEYWHLDVSSETSWCTALDYVVSKYDRLDVLVNNAGISGTFDSDLTSTEFFDQLMSVNARSVFLGIKQASRVMVNTGGGSIVNLSSISANIGQLGVHLGYGASKAAVKSMTRTAAVHYADDGIRVNAVAPGMLPPMQTSRGSADPVWRATQIAGVPMKREGGVQEVADVVLFLASDEASYVTGVEILVDGGLTAM